MNESHGEGSEQSHKEPCGEQREGLSSITGIEMSEGWIRDEIWTTEPTPETVQKLIAWFTDEMN